MEKCHTCPTAPLKSLPTGETLATLNWLIESTDSGKVTRFPVKGLQAIVNDYCKHGNGQTHTFLTLIPRKAQSKYKLYKTYICMYDVCLFLFSFSPTLFQYTVMSVCKQTLHNQFFIPRFTQYSQHLEICALRM